MSGLGKLGKQTSLNGNKIGKYFHDPYVFKIAPHFFKKKGWKVVKVISVLKKSSSLLSSGVRKGEKSVKRIFQTILETGSTSKVRPFLRKEPPFYFQRFCGLDVHFHRFPHIFDGKAVFV